VKILLIDDHALIRAGLRMLLGTSEENVSWHRAGNITDALVLLGSTPICRCGLLDLALKNEHGLAAIHRIKEDGASSRRGGGSPGAEDSAHDFALHRRRRHELHSKERDP